MKIQFQDANYICIDQNRKNGRNIKTTWVGSNNYEHAIFCIKSSYMSYEDFIQKIENVDIKEIPESCLYLREVVVSERSFEFDYNIMNTPFDIIVLPLNKDTVIMPSKDNFDRLCKTIKMDIKYNKEIIQNGFFGLGKNKINKLSFTVGRNMIPFEDAIIYYTIDRKSYPITKKMFNQVIEIIVPKTMEISVNVNRKYMKYYQLRGGE